MSIVYGIDYQNAGTGDAQNIVITDIIPNGTVYVSGGDRVEAGVVYWDIASLTSGATGSVEMRVTVE